MNKILASLGLYEWNLIWEPDHHQVNRGQIIPKTKTILISDEEASEALETLLHEALEIKMRPLLGVYRETVNHLIAIIEEIAYRQKEQLIDELVTYFFDIIRERVSSPENNNRRHNHERV